MVRSPVVESWSYDCLPYIVDEDWYRACVGACSVDGRHPDVDGEVAEGVLDSTPFSESTYTCSLGMLSSLNVAWSSAGCLRLQKRL